MPGIIISQIENIDEEPDYDKLAAERARKLREKRLGVNKEAIELKKKEDAAKQQAEIDRSRTSVNVTNTQNGTVTTTTTTSPNGTTSTETVTTSVSDDPFTDEVETGEDTSVEPPKEEENINEQEATENQNEIEQFDKPHIDSNIENNLIKQGIDTSDVEAGKETQRESIPENPKPNPNDPVLNNGNNGNNETKTEHCVRDTKPEEKPEEKPETSSVIIGENPREQGEEIAIPSESATCPSPNTNSLNDFQKEVLWVALDMLKWQPTTDTYGEGKKRYWDYLDIGDSKHTTKSFYNSYTYPDDPTFGRFKHKGKNHRPLDRLFTFYNGFNSEKPSLDKAPKWAWCAVTTSVMYMFAFLQMEVTHKDSKSVQNHGSSIWSPKLNKSIQMPFKKHNNSGHIVGSNSRNFGYNLSWEPTPGSIMFKLNNGGSGSDCGHSGLVMDVTKDKSIITIEGNGGQDCSIRVWPRDTYYEDAWRISHSEKWINEKMGWKGIHEYDKLTAAEKTKGRQLDHGHCGYHDNKTDESKWWKVKIPPYPTDSKWHWLFLNPSISNDVFSDIKGKPSREGNPLPELYSLLDGFYNREGSGGTLNSSAVR